MREPKALDLPFGGPSTRKIVAGSFKNFPEDSGFYGIKLAPEVSVESSLTVPIRDFGLPQPEHIYSALRVALYRIAMGQKVYVGCMGGYGRTGTFLALLYRALGVPDSIKYVRRIYDDRAVETRAQEEFVKTLPLDPLWKDLTRARYFALLLDWKEGRLVSSVGKNGGGHPAVTPRKRKPRAPRLVVDWDAGPEPRWLAGRKGRLT